MMKFIQSVMLALALVVGVSSTNAIAGDWCGRTPTVRVVVRQPTVRLVQVPVYAYQLSACGTRLELVIVGYTYQYQISY